ncbi:MAG: helix-hairpin-helix domain-containing protein [Hornefia sp.]|nr:helix-hairpin-helix domain-containing protein [Hornefia sp.]
MDKLREVFRKAVEHEHIFKILAVIILIITAFLLFGPKGENDSITLEKGKDSGNAVTKEEGTADKNNSGKIYVDVSGEVKMPGVYEISSESRIFEAIEKAGGLTKKADTGTINQAETVKDGQKIIVPRKNEGNSMSGAGAGGVASANNYNGEGGKKININSADAKELQKISGVGPSTAEKILQFRSSNGGFKSIEELKKISGIGDKTFKKMQPYVTI